MSSNVTEDPLLARLKEILSKKAYEAAQKAAKEGPLALQIAKNPHGDKIVQVVAVKAGRIGGGAYHKRDKRDQSSALYNFQHTTTDVERLSVSRKQMMKGGKAVKVATLDAQPALYAGGTIEAIKSYFAKNTETYAVFYSSSTEFSGQDAPDEQDLAMFPEQYEGQAGLEPGPVSVYVSGLALLKAGAKEYTTHGSLGDVIAEVSINVINFAGGAAGGAGGEHTTLFGQLSGAATEIVGGVNDAKDLYEKYFKGDEKKESLWNREFVEDNLQLEVCVAPAPLLDGKSTVLASDSSLQSEVIKMDGQDMLVISLGEVEGIIPGLLDKALGDLEGEVAAKSGAERRQAFAKAGHQQASRNLGGQQ